MNSGSLELTAEDCSLLGKSYGNDFPLVVEQDASGVRIVPPPTPWFGLFLLTGIIASFFAGVTWLLLQKPEPLEPFDWYFVALTAFLAIVGPLVAHLWRLHYLRQISPLLEFNAGTQTVSIHGGKHRFPANEVYCLLALSAAGSGSEVYSELQLVIDHAKQRSRQVISTSIFSSAESTFGAVARTFGEASGLRVVLAEPKGFFSTGDMKFSLLAERSPNIPGDGPTARLDSRLT